MQTQQPPENMPNNWTLGAVLITDFDAAIGHVLHMTTHIARDLIGAHRAAAAMIVGSDWKTVLVNLFIF